MIIKGVAHIDDEQKRIYLSNGSSISFHLVNKEPKLFDRLRKEACDARG
jgi:hypothetical protein